MEQENELTTLPEKVNSGFNDVGADLDAVEEGFEADKGLNAGSTNSWEFQQQTPDPSTLDDQTLLAELQRRQQMQPQPAQPHYLGFDPRLAQIVELSYSNPAMAEALRLQIAEERAEARVMERLGPAIQPIIQREALQNSGLSAHGQQYLSETFAHLPGLDVGALMSNPVTRDVLTRAARQYEVERSHRMPRYESAASEAPTLSAEDWKAVRDFERMTGDRLDSDVIKNARRTS